MFALGDIYTRVRYGDAGLVYGMSGLIYGGLRRLDNVRPYLTLEGSLSISQKIEPEQARASISTFSLVLIDKDGYLSKLAAPNVLVDEVLGGKEVKIYLGYLTTSFPEDYFVVFRGTVSSITINGPKVTLALSDANQRRRRPVFNTGRSKLTAPLLS